MSISFNILIWILSIITLINSILVIISINPVHSIINMILTFLNMAILLIILDINYLGAIYIIVYVGAIMILFLFVIMMLNIKVEEHNMTYNGKFIAILIGTIYILLIGSIYILFNRIDLSQGLNQTYLIDNLNIAQPNLINLIGEILYNSNNSQWLIIISLILLVGMIGSILLTLDIIV